MKKIAVTLAFMLAFALAACNVTGKPGASIKPIISPALAQATDTEAKKVWLVTATVKDEDGDVRHVLFFKSRDPAYRFADEKSCKGFLGSDDESFKAANESLAAQVKAMLGDKASVTFACTEQDSE